MRANVSFTDDPNDALRRAELVGDTFARLDHRQLGFTTAVLWARRDMLAERTGVGRLGFLDRTSPPTGAGCVPLIDEVKSRGEMVSLRTPTSVREIESGQFCGARRVVAGSPRRSPPKEAHA
jgi:hypothetical protein